MNVDAPNAIDAPDYTLDRVLKQCNFDKFYLSFRRHGKM